VDRRRHHRVYPLAATLQSEPDFGRVLAAYGGVFIASAFVWGAVFDGFRPDRFDVAGALVCLLGVSVIMFGPR
jgi:small multidrug resistance family-3 protein